MKKQIQLLRGAMVFLALLTINSTAFAGFVIKSGATIKVKSGTSLVAKVDVTVSDGATVTNDGTITLRKNFTNNGTANLGTGEFILEGTTGAQLVDGTAVSEFGILTVNNSDGVSLGNSVRVNTGMTMTTGVVELYDYNFTVGPGVTSVSGTFDATCMIATNGTGEMRKEYEGALGSFLFPVGELDGTVEYSPITLNTTAGDFTGNKFLGVRVVDAKHPNNNSYDHYLTRYWQVNEDGGSEVSGLAYDATATYVDDDIVGGETSINEGIFITPDWFLDAKVDDLNNEITFTGLEDGGDITGLEAEYFVGFKVFLQGAYDVATDEMRTDVNSIIPLSASTAYAHLGYGGPESVTTMPTEAVDWVLVELRDASSASTATSGTVEQTVAGLLMKDGRLVAEDGVSDLPFTFSCINDPYFVIIHRNHLGITTAVSPPKVGSTHDYDFTTVMSNAWGTDPMVEIDASPAVIYGLYGGETNNSSTISNADKRAIDMNMNVSDYLPGDINFSGTVTNADKGFVDNNMNKSAKVPY